MKEGFKITAVGVMSGTSLDGLDICLCEFEFDGNWTYGILDSDCISYGDKLTRSLSTAHLLTDTELASFDFDYGVWIGNRVNDFLQGKDVKPDLVCSHGHTVKHEPNNGITLQIGCGKRILETTCVTTVSDFRSLDVRLGGQGAPLVPIGDKLLFSEFDACLNLGGFSNISFEENGFRKAFDICPVNIVLNRLANRLGYEYDDEGNLARSGNLLEELLEELNSLPIYVLDHRPSLAREWLALEFLPILDRYDSFSKEDMLRTIVEHASVQIAAVLQDKIGNGKVLITGGGAYNRFLIERIKAHCESVLEIPDSELIEFKEALVFAFLGVLRFKEEINVLKSVTGASKDSSSGVIHRGDS